MLSWRRFLQQLTFACVILLVIGIIIRLELPGSPVVRDYMRFVLSEDLDRRRLDPRLEELWAAVSDSSIMGVLTRGGLWDKGVLDVFGGTGRNTVTSPAGR